MATMHVVDLDTHNKIIAAAYQARGYTEEEAKCAAHWCGQASWHGIRTHNGIKALHLDHLFGSKAGGSTPGAEIEVLPSRFKAVERWNGNYKLGQCIAERAMNRAMELADEYGCGTISVDNTFHYLWGGGYVIEAAKKGYIAYTCCSTTLSEVVPFNGKTPSVGTNPHTWGFPTVDALGFPICVDFATSIIAMGKVQQLKREGKEVPPGCAIDKNGNLTTDPNEVYAILPMAQHKGFGLALVIELLSAMSGGSLPTIRGLFNETHQEGEKLGTAAFFQVIHPEAMGCDDFACGRSQQENIKAVLDNIRTDGNEATMFPGQIEYNAAQLSEKHGGLLFSDAEVKAVTEIAEETGVAFDPSALKSVEV